MPSQFFGLTIAGSGIMAQQAAINATANNISNVQTKGYSRQVANISAGEALRVNAKYGSIGTGVSTDSIKQLRNEYYDRKYWENESRVGYYENKLYYMSQIENYFIDNDEITGFTALMTKMDNALNELKGDNATSTERKAFISTTKSLTDYFNSIGNELQRLQSGINDQIKTTVENVNSILQKMALLNKEINVIELQGGYANELRDERNLLADELSAIMPVEISEVEIVNSNDPDMYLGGHEYTVKIQGQYLVDGYDFYELECVAREELKNQSDTTGLYDIRWKNTGVYFGPTSAAMDGTLKALFEMRDGNNNANFQGVLGEGDDAVVSDDATDPTNRGYTVKFENTATQKGITTPDFNVFNMNMPSTGIITINNHEYTYDGFQYTTTMDEDGVETVKSVSFHITDGDSYLATSRSVAGRVGEAVDCLGVPYYQNQLNAFLRSYMQKFNNIQESGVTLDENAMGAYYVAKDRMSDGELDFSDYSNDYKEIQSKSEAVKEKKEALAAAQSATYATQADEDAAIAAAQAALDAAQAELDAVTEHTYSFGSTEGLLHYGVTDDSDTYYRLTALNVNVADATQKDSNRLATTVGNKYKDKNGVENGESRLDDGVDQADLTVKMLDLYDKVTIVRGTKAKDFLQCIIDDVSVDTEETKTFINNYNSLKNAIQTQRDSVSGVDEDEEALDLLKFQKAYNLSSKVIQILTEIYDRLILETGV